MWRRNMWRRNRLEGDIAAAVYGDLTAEERRKLEARLAKNPEWARELEAMANLAESIPKDLPECSIDLLPQIRARLATRTSSRPAGLWRPAMFAAASIALAGVFAYTLWHAWTMNPAEIVAENVRDEVAKTPVQVALDEAAPLVAQGSAAEAFSSLADALRQHPGDPYAAQAQLRLAEMAYEELRWYEKADEAYKAYAAEYPAHYRMHPESTRITARRNILAEARADGYKPIRTVEVARNRGEEAIPELERVIARFPGSTLAVAASQQIVRALAPENTALSGRELAQVLETARERCTQPAAIAHLGMELAQVYERDLEDVGAARSILMQVAQEDGGQYAQVAASRLQHLPPQ